MSWVYRQALFGLRFDPASQNAATGEHQRVGGAVGVEHRQAKIAVEGRARGTLPSRLCFRPIAPEFSAGVGFGQEVFEALGEFVAAGQVSPPLCQVQLIGFCGKIGLGGALFGLRRALVTQPNVVAQPIEHDASPQPIRDNVLGRCGRVLIQINEAAARGLVAVD